MLRMEASFRVWTPVSDLILCTGSAQHFGSTLKASLGPPSICVASSHMNLTHVVGAMIVVDRQGIICGDAWEEKGALFCPHHANASAAAKAIS